MSTSKKSDIGEVLVSEGLAVTQRHRDDDEKSPSYDVLCAAEVRFPRIIYMFISVCRMISLLTTLLNDS